MALTWRELAKERDSIRRNALLPCAVIACIDTGREFKGRFFCTPLPFYMLSQLLQTAAPSWPLSWPSWATTATGLDTEQRDNSTATAAGSGETQSADDAEATATVPQASPTNEEAENSAWPAGLDFATLRAALDAQLSSVHEVRVPLHRGGRAHECLTDWSPLADATPEGCSRASPGSRSGSRDKTGAPST